MKSQDAGETPDCVAELLDRVETKAESENEVKAGELLDEIGRRSFGPVLLAIGMFLSVPGPSDVPGVPSTMGALVVLVVGQILLGRQYIWVPGWIEERKVSGEKLRVAVSWLRRPARWLDRISKPRWHRMVGGVGATAIGILSVVIALITPAMELVPLSGNLAGIALSIFGLSMISHDGLMATVAFVFAGAVLGLIGYAVVM